MYFVYYKVYGFDINKLKGGPTMLKKIMLILMLLPLTTVLEARRDTPRRDDSRNNAIRIANKLTRSLDKMSRIAARVEERADNNGRARRSRKFRKVKRIANRMSGRIEDVIVVGLEDGVALPRLKRKFNNMKNAGLLRLEDALAVIRRMPPRMEDSVANYQASKRALTRALGNRRPGGNGMFRARCRVVLETIWGGDIQNFQGRASGATRRRAIERAKRDGQTQCREELANMNGSFPFPLYKCTVTNSCTVNRRGGGGRRR